MPVFDDLTFAGIANFAVALAVIIAAILAVFYIIKWWIMAITAWWDQEKLKQWMHAIRYSIVWLVIVLLAVLMIKLVWAIFNVDLLWYLTFENISNMFNLIMERLQWGYKPVNAKPF